MKRNILFKTLIDIAYFYLVPFVIFMPAVIIYLLVFPEQQVINTSYVAFKDLGTIKVSIFIFLFYVEFLLFFKGFHELRSLAKLLLKKKLYTSKTILKLKKIGWLFTICGITTGILLIIYIITVSSYKLNVAFGFTDFQYLLFLIIIGVFFLILSDAFKKAVQFKEENELTV